MEHEVEAKAAEEAKKAKRLRTTKKSKSKSKTKMKLKIVDEGKAPSSSQISVTMISPEIVTHGFNIHGVPIVPKEEQIDLENINSCPNFYWKRKWKRK